MQFCGSLGRSGCLKADFRVGATVAAGSGVMKDTNLYGEIIPVAVNAAADAMGAVTEAATYDATPTASEGNAYLGAVAETVYDPLAIFEANISGSATASTALSDSTINYGTQTSASATVFTFAGTFTTDYNGGSICVTSGVNKGLVRIITSDIDSTSRTVTVAFPASIAVGDTALMVPYSRINNFLYFTTNFIELDGYTPDGSGAEGRVVDVVFDVDNLSAKGRFIFTDHNFAPIG